MAGATIEAVALEVGTTIPDLGVATDKDGRYFYPLPPGRFRLTVIAEGYEQVEALISISTGDHLKRDLVLHEAG